MDGNRSVVWRGHNVTMAGVGASCAVLHPGHRSKVRATSSGTGFEMKCCHLMQQLAVTGWGSSGDEASRCTPKMSTNPWRAQAPGQDEASVVPAAFGWWSGGGRQAKPSSTSCLPALCGDFFPRLLLSRWKSAHLISSLRQHRTIFSSVVPFSPLAAVCAAPLRLQTSD
jgi:hypothetical protein